MKAIAKLLIIIIYTFLIVPYIHAQSCMVNDTFQVLDLDTTYISLTIESAEFNDLASNDQGVEIVELAFRHLKVTDIEVNLISPAGQKVQLMGPTQTSTKATQTSRWDVDFIRDDLTVNPDADFNDRWSNLNDWIGSNYTGSYYPYQGALDDINMGTITGVWKIEIIDKIFTGIDFNPQTGEPFSFFTKFSIGFRKGDNITCLDCQAASSSVITEDILGCAGSGGLDFQLDYNIDQNQDDYGYGYIIYDSEDISRDLVFQHSTEVGLSDKEAGIYTLCGLHYYRPTADEINDLTYDELIDHITSGGICAKLSDNCFTVHIDEAPQLKNETVVICEDETYEHNGQIYTNSGIYEIKTPLNAYCDSISTLEIQVEIINVNITSSIDQLSCANRSSILSATGITEDMVYTWTDDAGNPVEEMNEFGAVLVSSPGTYWLDIQLRDCNKRISKTITSDDTYNSLSIEGDHLYCEGEEVLLDLNFDGDIATVEWSSNNSFINSGNDILIDEAGIYSVTVYNTAGCEFSAEYEVNSLIEELRLSDNDIELSCSNQMQSVEILGLNSNEDYNIIWQKDVVDISSDTSIEIYEEGSYTVSITNLSTDCVTELSLQVSSIVPEHELYVGDRKITCLDTEVELDYILLPFDIEVDNVVWLNSNKEVIGMDKKLMISNSGDYTLKLTTTEGCIFYAHSTVIDERNTDPLILEDVEKKCFEDVNLLPMADPDLDYTWTFPDGSIETGNPLATFLGQYSVTAVSKSSGCQRKGTLNVINKSDNISIPDVSFDKEIYTCGTRNPVIKTGLSTSDYNFNWSGDNIITNPNASEINVSAPGLYEVHITNALNVNCSARYVVEVEADTMNTISLSSDTLNCLKDSVQVFVDTDYTFSSIIWGGMPVSDKFVKEPFVKIEGEYRVVFTIEENGCMGDQTIFVPHESSTPSIAIESISSDVIQCNDEIQVSINPGVSNDSIISVSWVGPNIEEDNLDRFHGIIKEAGVYSVLVEGIGSCIDSTGFIISPDTLSPIVDITADGNYRCDNTEISLFLQSDLSYKSVNWSTEGNDAIVKGDTLLVMEPGDYIVEVEGENNCITEKTYSVSDDRVYPIYETFTDTITCDKTSVDIGITAENTSYNIVWTNADMNPSDDDYIIEVNKNGRYYLTVENDQSCMVVDSILVAIDTMAPNYDLQKSNDISCYNPISTLSVTTDDKISYNWLDANSNSEMIKVSDQGDYSVIGTALNGCTTEKSIYVEVDTTYITIESITADDLSCEKLSFLYIETDIAPDTYTWTYPEGYTSNEENPILQNGGLHTVEVIADNGCVTKDSIYIGDDRLFPIVEARDVYLRCDGLPITFILDTISSNSTVAWQGIYDLDYFNRGFDASASMSGTYEVIATNEAGCEVRDTFKVINDESFPEFGIDSKDLDCHGAKLMALDAEDDEFIEWKNPDGITIANTVEATGTQTGVYQLVVRGIFGCTDTLYTTVSDAREYPDITVNQNLPYQCNTKEVLLTAAVTNMEEDRITYKWIYPDGSEDTDSEESILATVLGTYDVVANDSITHCADTLTYTLQEEPQSFMDIRYEAYDPTCEGYNNGTIVFTDYVGDNPPYTTFVNDYNYGAQKEINYLDPDTYYIRVVDAIGCEVFDTIRINEAINPIIVMPSDTTVLLGDTITIRPQLNKDLDQLDSIYWQGTTYGSDDLTLTEVIDGNKEITLYVVDENGCEAEESFYIYVIDKENPFPNAFMPSSEVGNNTFYIPYLPSIEELIEVKILDNWGGLVYHETNPAMGDPTVGWDGTLNGNEVEPAVYVLIVKAKLIGGEIRQYISTVTLLR